MKNNQNRPIVEPICLKDNYYLTEMRQGDETELVRWLNDLVIYNNTIAIPYPYTQEDANTFIEQVLEVECNHQIIQNFAIRFHEQLVGSIGLLYNYGIDSACSEIGYWMGEDHRRKGLTSLAIGALCDYAAENTTFRILEAHIFLGNVGSVKALENNGFVHQGVCKKSFLKDGVFKDTNYMTKKIQ